MLKKRTKVCLSMKIIVWYIEAINFLCKDTSHFFFFFMKWEWNAFSDWLIGTLLLSFSSPFHSILCIWAIHCMWMFDHLYHLFLQNTQKWLIEDKKLAKNSDEADYDVEGNQMLLRISAPSTFYCTSSLEINEHF